MKHPDSESTATIERDLHAVDTALREGAADHDDPFVRELQELGLVLQAEAPQPAAEFAQALEERVNEGFPAKPGSPRAHADAAGSWLRDLRASMPPPRRLLPAAGALVTVVVIGIAVVRGLLSYGRQVLVRGDPELHSSEAIRLRLGRALALGLEFTVASDILHTAVSPTHQDIMNLGAIVLLRSLLNYFLEREIRQGEAHREV